MAKFGKLDVLYINHGIMPVGPVFNNSIEMIEKVINVNFMSFIYLTKLALPHLRASKGMIGITSSMAGTYCKRLFSALQLIYILIIRQDCNAKPRSLLQL